MDITSTRRWLAPVYRNAIYVMRHGRTVLDDVHRSDGWLDYPLSDEGRLSLIHAQQYLKMAPIKRVYASSLSRTKESAHIISTGIISHPELHIAEETRTWNLGDLIGTKKKPNKPRVQYLMAHPDEKPEGGESMREFAARFVPWLQARVQEVREGEGPYLVVTSGSNLREIGIILTGDKDSFDLDESGLMVLNVGEKLQGQVIFGHKTAEDEMYS